MQLTIVGLLLAGGGTTVGERDVVALTDRAVVQFASVDEGREILTTSDAFSASLSRFDLQCRVKNDREVTIADWKKMVAESVRPWERAEMAMVSRSLARLDKRMEKPRLPRPPVI